MSQARYGYALTTCLKRPSSAIDASQVTGSTKGTQAFDKAEADGTPLAIATVTPPRAVRNALPLDQLEIGFKAASGH